MNNRKLIEQQETDKLTEVTKLMKVKYLKEYLDTLDEDAPIAYWLWQVADIEEEIEHFRLDCSDRWDKDILNKLTSDDIAYILDSINEYFDNDVVYHAVSHALDRVTA